MGLLSETNDVTALGFLFLIGGIIGIILGGPICGLFPIIGLIMIAVGITYNPLKKKEDESKRFCPKCGREIPFDANICPYCKQQSEGRKMQKNNDDERAIEILNKRYVKGEITDEQYQRMKREIEDIPDQNIKESSNKDKKGISNSKNKQISMILIIMIMAISISIVAYAFFGNNDDNYLQNDLNNYNDWENDLPTIPTYHSVVLEVTGSADSVSLSYTLDDSSLSSDYVTLPWSRSRSFADDGEWYYVYAQNNGEYGWIEATLTIDGEVIETDKSYSSYGVVSVGGYT